MQANQHCETEPASNLATKGNTRFPQLNAPVIGIDMGGTKINAAIVPPNLNAATTAATISGTGFIQNLTSTATPKTANEFLQNLIEMINQLKQMSPNAQLIGISTAGVVDAINGTILGSTGNMPALAKLSNLKAELQNQVGMPVHIENDANAAAYGEWCLGSSGGVRNMVAITLGTGVGMGIVLEHQLYRGSHFFAAEGGHIAIAHNQERKCTCGRWDCWEAFASGTGLQKTAELNVEAASEAIQSDFLKQYCPDNEPVSTYTVISAWKEQHPLGIKIMDDWHNHIAVGLGSVINIMDPDVVVVGGGLAQFVNFTQLTERTKKRALSVNFKVVPATLGNYAGIVGAAYLAAETHKK
ncbi:MAG: ROK family protein [Cyanobacteria bacterium P01_H01_bin.74]